MLFPANFTDRFFDGYMNFPAERDLLKTDVKDAGNHLEFLTDMPGYSKEDVSAKIDKGVLTIEARTSGEKEDNDDSGRFIRRERYQGSCSRSFFVGREVKPEHITASLSDGILRVCVEKPQPKPVIEEDKYIPIG